MTSSADPSTLDTDWLTTREASIILGVSTQRLDALAATMRFRTRQDGPGRTAQRRWALCCLMAHQDREACQCGG